MRAIFLFCVLNACLFCCMYVITRYLIMQYKFISFLFFSFLSKSSLYFFVYYSQWRYFRHACARNCFSLESLFFLICTRYVSFFGAKKARISSRRAFPFFLFLFLFICSQPRNCSFKNYYFWIFLNAQVRFIIWKHQKSNTKPKIREDKDHVYNKRKI